MPVVSSPANEAELFARAVTLQGRTLADVSFELGRPAFTFGLRTKGSAGALIEHYLGASAGSTSQPDFPHLGIELKTIPVDRLSKPLESTYVTTLAFSELDRLEWETSAVYAKLRQVLFVPILMEERDRPRIGMPLLWRATSEQLAVLKTDFEDIVGAAAIGNIEAMSGRVGRWLQLRPKAANGRVRSWTFGGDGEWIATVPRGFYLRARLTKALLADPAAIPD